MTILIYLMAVYGLTFGIQNKIGFLHDRNAFLDALLACPYCLGFWTGWLVWGASWALQGQPVLATSTDPLPLVASGVLWAFASTAWCYVLHVGIVWLESNIGPEEG